MENKEKINKIFKASFATYAADLDISTAALESLEELCKKHNINWELPEVLKVIVPITMSPHVSLFSRVAPFEEYIKNNMPTWHNTIFTDLVNLLEEKGYGGMIERFKDKKRNEDGK